MVPKRKTKCFEELKGWTIDISCRSGVRYDMLVRFVGFVEKKNKSRGFHIFRHKSTLLTR